MKQKCMYCGDSETPLKKGSLGWYHEECFLNVSLSVRDVLRTPTKKLVEVLDAKESD